MRISGKARTGHLHFKHYLACPDIENPHIKVNVVDPPKMFQPFLQLQPSKFVPSVLINTSDLRIKLAMVDSIFETNENLDFQRRIRNRNTRKEDYDSHSGGASNVFC